MLKISAQETYFLPTVIKEPIDVLYGIHKSKFHQKQRQINILGDCKYVDN